MYSCEDRIRAVEREIKLGKCVGATIRQRFCRKRLKGSQTRLPLDTVVLQVQRIAEMAIGHCSKIDACGSCEPIRCHPVSLRQTERI